MKKNGQYVGVDEKFIPEDEKYVDNTLNNEIKGVVKDGIQSAKDYVSNKDNQENIKKNGKKGLKFLKGLGIGYLAIIGSILLLVIVGFVFVFSSFFKISNSSEDMMDSFFGNINDFINNVDNNNKDNSIDETINQIKVYEFNSEFEKYIGTQKGSKLKLLLNQVVSSISKYKNHSITIIYGDNNFSQEKDIIALKKEIIDTEEYEVFFNYDNDGYIYKVNIDK